MLSRMSSYFLRTLREDPVDAEIASHRLLVRAGYIRRVAPGIYTWLPLGLRVLRKVEDIVRRRMDEIGGNELLFPALLPSEPYQASGRWEDYGPNLFRLQDRREADMLLAPTHEEMFALAVKDMFASYKDLPIFLYQVQTKYRDEARPRAGVLRGREFVMKDSYSFDLDHEGLDASYFAHRAAYQKIFADLGLEAVICSAQSGAMGGSRSEEFLHPTEVGEDTFVRSPGGYAANAEAVVTLAPEPLSAEEIAAKPASYDLRTPDAGTILSLVQQLHELAPRTDGRAWDTTDTLKAQVYMVTEPDGSRSPLLVGIPGDRQIDEKRLAAELEPADVRPFTDAEFADEPRFVKGFIGPRGFGLGEVGNGIRSLVDPRVVDGTEWVAGANRLDHHAVGLVAGRDFTWDGTIEAAEVRAGDPAPDGSGPLELARGIEMGHIFQLGTKYADALDLTVLDRNGTQRTVTMGSYGFGVSRALAALAEQHHDEKGLAWPRHVAPMDVHVLATGKDPAVFEFAERLSRELSDVGVDVLYDDRPKVSPGVKFKDAELIGLPTGVVVGKLLVDGRVEVRDRAAGTIREVPADDALAEVLAELGR